MSDPLLDDPDVRVEVFTGARRVVRLTHTPTGTIATAADGRAGQLELQDRAAAELRWKLSLPAEELAVLQRCLCGSVYARLKGQDAWARMDILCPVCDS
jgi:hypothetical protein